MEESESADTDLLVCGSCKRSFHLGNITGFMKHKKFDCEDPGNATDPKSKMLVCLSCRQKFTTPWCLLKHAQNVHFLQIYLEQTYGLGVQSVSIADEHPADQSYTHLPDFDHSLSALPGEQTVQQWIQGIEQEMERVEDPGGSGPRTANSGGKGSQQMHTMVSKLEGAVCLQSTSCDSAPVSIGKSFGSDVSMTKRGQGKLMSAVPSTSAVSPNSRPVSVVDQPVTHGKQIKVLMPVSSEAAHESPTRKSQVSHGKRLEALIPMSSETMGEHPLSKSPVSHGKRLEALTPVSSGVLQEPIPGTSKPQISHGKRIEALIPMSNAFPQDSPQVSKPLISYGKRISGSPTLTSSEIQQETFISLPQMSFGDQIKSLLPMAAEDVSTDRKMSVEIATQTNHDLGRSDGLMTLEQGQETSGKEPENCCDNPDCCVRKAKLGNFCENQNCGITVMPGTHESLKKCCNAVVPKLRKRHIEIKHKSGHKFISRGRRREKVRKTTSPADIYIDLAPMSTGNVSSGSKSDNGDEDEDDDIVPSNNNNNELTLMSSSSMNNNNGITNMSFSKQKSVIIQPGSTFSIPIPYSSTGAPPTISKSFTNMSSTVLISSQKNPATVNPVFEQQSSSQKSLKVHAPSDNSQLSALGSSAKLGTMDGLQLDVSQAIFETLGCLSTGPKIEQSDAITSNFFIQSLKEATQMSTPSKNINLTKDNSDLDDQEQGLDLVVGQDLDIPTFDPNEAPMALTVDVGRADLEDGVGGKKRRYPTSKPYKCDQCDHAFNQRIHLKKHLSKHTGIKPFKCDQCDYSTVERSHLKVHIRVHTGEKPFKCTYCEYATAQNSTLKIHLKRHHAATRGAYRCSDCGKGFSQKSLFESHVANTHELGLLPCDGLENHALALLPAGAQVRENAAMT